MEILSVNMMLAVARLLNRLDEYRIQKQSDLYTLPSFANIRIDNIVDFAMECGLVKLTDDKVHITENGKEIAVLEKKVQFSEQCFRKIIRAYVLEKKPIWAYKIPYGRKEAAVFMTKDERACFAEANLLKNPPSDPIVCWWDEIANSIRNQDSESKNDIGRTGERITIQYEFRRTKRLPEWTSIDTNKAGYDIKSIYSEFESKPLYLEVKSSTKEINYAKFHITSNEWNCARGRDDHIFYLWLLDTKQLWLAKVYPSELEEVMPINRVGGTWESVVCNYSAFEHKFSRIEGNYEQLKNIH